MRGILAEIVQKACINSWENQSFVGLQDLNKTITQRSMPRNPIDLGLARIQNGLNS
jgi:hypothetical protein